MAVNALRDALLERLNDVPGVREFHLHVLVSSPRKHNNLYPFAIPKQRAYMQDILILLAEQKTPDSPRIIVSGIEATLYNIPTTSSAILYVSKVDSSGHASYPSPTATLVRALLLYYADPATRPVDAQHLWIQLFARAQNQYLFPNSSEYAGKRPLSDARLCAWWKKVLTDVTTELRERSSPPSPVKLHYLLPGFARLEAEHTIASKPTTVPWTYGHPYSDPDTKYPCPSPPEDMQNLGHFIPYFDDCPKSRFLDEIAYTTESSIKSPPRKRTRTESLTRPEQPDETETQAPKKDERPLGELENVSPDEFWERMSFRQECVAGAVTGFFSMHVEPTNDSSPITRSSPSPLEPQPGQVSSQINKRIITTMHTGVEFATVEYAVRATETLETAIRGLCEGISSIHQPVIQAPARRKPSSSRKPESSSSSSLKPVSSSTFLAPAPPEPPRTPPRRGLAPLPDISPNPFPEPEASLETYYSHIYGSVCVSNPELPRRAASATDGSASATEAPKVTVLAVRKKKKKPE